MDEKQLHARVRMDSKGRVEIPKQIREALGLHPGEELVLRVKDGRLEAETVEALLDRLQSWFLSVPDDVSLADELIAERRQEALRDLED